MATSLPCAYVSPRLRQPPGSSAAQALVQSSSANGSSRVMPRPVVARSPSKLHAASSARSHALRSGAIADFGSPASTSVSPHLKQPRASPDEQARAKGASAAPCSLDGTVPFWKSQPRSVQPDGSPSSQARRYGSMAFAADPTVSYEEPSEVQLVASRFAHASS